MGLRPLWLLGAMALWGCSGQMADQPAYETGEIALLPASGSIPMTPNKPWAYRLSPGEATPSNPLAVTRPVLASGERLYTDYCSFCHGVGGKGDGPVGEVFAPRPANLTMPRIVAYPDGRIYEVITNGYSTMPAFYNRLSPEERWAIVAHVRRLQHGRD